MNTLTRTNSVLAGFSALTLFAITGCSGEAEADATSTSDAAVAEEQVADEQLEDTPAEGVFAFSPLSDAQGQELRIEIPAQLLEDAEAYREDRILESVTVRSTEHPESQCAIEMDYNYAEGAQAQIEDDEWWHSSRYEPEEYLPEIEDRVPGELVDETKSLEERYVDILELDTNMESTDGITEDGQSAIFPMACAEDPTDTDDVVQAPFKFFRLGESINPDLPGEESIRHPVAAPFATVDLNVMASGDIHVVYSEVEGYHFSGDEHGWLSDTQTVDSQGNVIDS